MNPSPHTPQEPTTHVNADRIVLVHGFTQTARSWRPTVERLTAGLGPEIEIVALDVPGHGDRGDVRTDLPSGAAMLGDEGGKATYIGYSMGGRLCLHLALAAPNLVERLVLISTTPGIEDVRERDARRAADDELADEIERAGVGAFLEHWLSQPLFAGLAGSDADIESRLANTPAGLASSLRLAGTGTQAPLWSRLGEIEVPVLVVAGEHDPKFTDIGRRMADSIPGATLVVVEGAGHAAHLERPDETCDALIAWLRSRHPPIANPSANSAP
jgi:2-succinyl-6-hydroxy-2,4-cyclohexadiene-1-carboxylate synthase